MTTLPDKRAATLPTEHKHSDAELIKAVRAGELTAYGAIYERHVAAAYRFARQFSASQQDVDDLVAETFVKVLEAIKAGRGPDAAFRPYLLTALRHAAYDANQLKKRQRPVEDIDPAQPFDDNVLAKLEHSLIARAFSKLPERWQAVLWHTEIEREKPVDVAPILGLTPNGVSALAYRARERLKQAYLQAHVSDGGDPLCVEAADLLGAWTRGGLGKRERTIVDGHLQTCERCRELADDLRDVNRGLRAVIAPLVLGAGVLSYLGIQVDTPEFAEFAWMFAVAAGLRPAVRQLGHPGARVAVVIAMMLFVLVVALALAR